MASTRLRKAFHYPSDSDSDSDLNDLDEEHQERLIARLASEDAQKTLLYTRVFIGIPLLGAVFCLAHIVHATSSRARLLALLSASSLVCTAYVLHFQPVRAQDRKGKKALWRVDAERGGPVQRYLVWMNAVLAGVLLVVAWVSWGRGGREDGWREGLPAVIFAISMFARQQLAPLDLEELQKARYEFKGA